MLDIVVEGNAYLDGKINKCCIGIEDGKIVAVKKILKGEVQLDFGDKLILPAGIDIHVHFRDPGYSKKEDFRTGTLAAAFGGIGCIYDMPNTDPFVASTETFMDKLQIVSKKAHIDFGLYASVTNKTNIPKLAKLCSGFKIYLGETTGKVVLPKNASLNQALIQINQNHRVPALHAEAEHILRKYASPSKPSKTLNDHLRKRPNSAEEKAVSKLLTFVKKWQKQVEDPTVEQNTSSITNLDKKIKSLAARQLGSENAKIDKNTTSSLTQPIMRLHFSHMSTKESVALLRKFYDKSIEQYRKKHQLDHVPINQNAIQELKNLENIPLPLHRQQNGSNTVQDKLMFATIIYDTNKNNVVITSEVTPHHLIFNKNCGLGAFGKVNPPLRQLEDQLALWTALNDGTIQVLASDHAPHTIDEKNKPFSESPAGIPGVETMLPLMLSFHKHHKINLPQLVSASSIMPANIFKLPKGKLAPGYDGDLIVIDFYNEREIKLKDLHSKCSWTPYERMNAIFPILTMVRGKIIIRDGNLESDPGFGKFYN